MNGKAPAATCSIMPGSGRVSDLRRGDFATLRADWGAFRHGGLLQGGLARIWREHREVRNYHRAMSNRDALLRLAGAPPEWT